MKKSSLIKKANSRPTFQINRLPLVVLALVLCVSLYFVVPVVLSSVVAAIWYPFDAVRIWVAHSGSSLPQYLRERTTLIHELEALKIQIATEQGTENTIKKLEAENEELRKLTGSVPDARILARVVGRPGSLPYDVVMLDRGRAHGVTENTPVFLGADQVIGFVSKVNEKSSLVTLVTSPGFTASAYVIGPNIYTFAQGVGGGMMRVRIPQGMLLRTGDLVLLPAIDSGVYGTISYVETSPTAAEQYGYVSTGVPIQNLYYVSIGTETITPHTFADAESLVESVKQTLLVVDVPPEILVTPETATTSASTTIPVTPTTTSTTTPSRQRSTL